MPRRGHTNQSENGREQRRHLGRLLAISPPAGVGWLLAFLGFLLCDGHTGIETSASGIAVAIARRTPIALHRGAPQRVFVANGPTDERHLFPPRLIHGGHNQRLPASETPFLALANHVIAIATRHLHGLLLMRRLWQSAIVATELVEMRTVKLWASFHLSGLTQAAGIAVGMLVIFRCRDIGGWHGAWRQSQIVFGVWSLTRFRMTPAARHMPILPHQCGDFSL